MKFILFHFFIYTIFLGNNIAYAEPTLALRCEIIFNLRPSENPEYWNLQNLKSFLYQNVSNYLLKSYEPSSQFSIAGSNKAVEYYTSEFGHRKINSSIWQFDAKSDINNQIQLLYNYLADGNIKTTLSFAGATIPKKILEKFINEKKLEPGYFFSTSTEAHVAEEFMANFGNHHPPSDYVKVLYHVQGSNGRNISNLSIFNESEFLYLPDTDFTIVKIEPRSGLNQNGYQMYDIYLEEKLILPAKNQQRLEFQPERDLLKIQSLETYQKLKSTSPASTLDKYSKETKIDYQNAVEFVYNNYFILEPNIQVLQKIHQLTTEHLYFEGIYRQLIRDDFLSGKITETEAIERLYNIQNADNIYKLKTTRFRSQWHESFIMNGLHYQQESNQWYFTKEELYQISINPFYNLKTPSIREVSPGKYTAIVLLPPGPKVASLVEDVFKNSMTAIQNAQNDKEYVLQVLKLQQALLSIHPFHDGNGRAIKLFSDLLYLKRGLSPILHPINDDYGLTLNKIYLRTVESMNLFQNFSE